MKYFAALGALSLMVACGNSDHGNFVDSSGGVTGNGNGAGGHQNRAGAGNSDNGGSEGGEGGAAGDGTEQSDALAPVVEITAPSSVSDPNDGKVLTGSSVKVVCSAKTSSAANAQPVLGSSVTIQMFGADGKQIGKDGAVMSTTNAGEYAASFALTAVPSGPLSLKCSANDADTTPHTGVATIVTFYDAGPTISLSDPADKSARPLGATQFKFSALPSPLDQGDSSAAVTKVTLKVDGVAIDSLMPVAGKDGYYQASVDLNDKQLFASPPVGAVSVVITATNKRGTVATSDTTFVVDSAGPLIAIVSPSPDGVQFVAGQVTLTFTVTDEMGGSGVNPDTVAVSVNQAQFVSYKPGSSWHTADGKTFTYSFNVKDFTVSTQVSVSIKADDNAGNHAPGASANYYVDERPPIVDLQPPALQEIDSSTSRCSEPFDPLADSPKDLSVVPATNKFQVLVWDVGNQPDSLNGIEFFSDIDTTKGVRLYFQEDTTKPIVKSDVAGGVCNQIADLTLRFSNMMPIPPAGASYFDAAAPNAGNCTTGTEATPPKRLCNQNSQLTRVIQHEVATPSSVAVVFGISSASQTTADPSLCTGGQLDLTTKVSKDGWFCAAVAAQDKVGNVAVSVPIRLCLDAAAYADHPACAVSSTTPPTCLPAGSNGCTMPARFTKTLIVKP